MCAKPSYVMAAPAGLVVFGSVKRRVLCRGAPALSTVISLTLQVMGGAPSLLSCGTAISR